MTMNPFKNDLVSVVKTINVGGNSITFSLTYSKKNQVPMVIIYLHGGFSFVEDGKEYQDLSAYARAGFVCLGIKYPEDDTKNIGLLKDVIEVYDLWGWAKKQWPRAKGIFLVGVSRGGFVAYHALADYPRSLFDKGVVCCGPTDLTLLRKTTAMPKPTLDRLWSYLNWANSEIVSSPIYYTKTIGAGPLYMAYGVKDTIIPIEQGRRMWKAMQPSNPKSVYKEFNEGHGLANNAGIQKEIMGFLLK
jgi:dipeptidyl aminopeptidase/acylaminoacyl peptidase